MGALTPNASPRPAADFFNTIGRERSRARRPEATFPQIAGDQTQSMSEKGGNRTRGLHCPQSNSGLKSGLIHTRFT